jgi:Flp pilus assembly protein TadD
MIGIDMRVLTVILLLLLASCGERSPAGPVVLEPPAPALAAWKPTLHLADTALSSGAPRIALQVTDQLLAKNNRDAGALVRRGDALAMLEHASEAASSYSMAIKIEPKDTRALMGLGRVRLTQDPAAAEILFAQVIALERGNAPALCDLGVARDLQGHYAAAQEAYHLALRVAPASVAARVNLGLSTALAGDAAGGARLLQPLAASPDASPRIRQDLAVALALEGDRSQAMAVMGQDLPPDQINVALDGFAALRP